MPGSSGSRRRAAGPCNRCSPERLMADLDALKLVRALDQGAAARTGASFFPHMVSALAQTLGASCAFASEFDHETYQAHVLAFWCDGSFRANFVYHISGF